MNRPSDMVSTAAEFIELLLVATLVFLLTPIWLPVRMAKRVYYSLTKKGMK